jgi:hypothetical protein
MSAAAVGITAAITGTAVVTSMATAQCVISTTTTDIMQMTSPSSTMTLIITGSADTLSATLLMDPTRNQTDAARIAAATGTITVVTITGTARCATVIMLTLLPPRSAS